MCIMERIAMVDYANMTREPRYTPYEYLTDMAHVCMRVLELNEWHDADGLSMSQIKRLDLMGAELRGWVKCRPISAVKKVKVFLRLFEENRADLLRTFVKILDDNDELWMSVYEDILTLDARGHHELQSEINEIMNEVIDEWEVYER